MKEIEAKGSASRSKRSIFIYVFYILVFGRNQFKASSDIFCVCVLVSAFLVAFS